ncbi:AraC family transcriptional regulator [Bacteroides oleiciplenus]|uniref:AraC family transcriptional regulator n=1 Tax=Bacteroides oleiciplenus TaxID=626931 RepID=A0A3E5BLS8_9BACE|nr:helix-turn-helix domain-containing protein [Bacteroides oleiciplenus]RGN38335.1 AraC family transcriptional regulator [Bacteroides oleiciplenus]
MRHFYICLLLLGFLPVSVLASGDKGTKDIYTEQYIADIYMDEPKRALQLLNEAETKQALPIYMVDGLRSMVYSHLYQDKSAFHYARRAYVHDSISGNHPDHLLKMTITLADLSHTLSEYKESNRYAVEGLELARRLNDREAECKLLFCMGENKWMLSLKDEGYEFFDKAIALLDTTEDVKNKSMLSYFYGVKMGYLINDNRLEDALQIGLQREKLLDGMKGNPEVREAFLDQQYGYVYSKLSRICHLLGDVERGKEYHKKYQSTHAYNTPAGKRDATPYLLVTKQYQAVLDHCRDFKELMRRQDTLNIQYVGVLQREIDAYLALKDYEKVAALRASILSITDSIYRRDKTNVALELDNLYEVNEKEARIAEQAFQLTIRTITLVFILCISLLSLFFLWRMWVQNRKIKRKNQVLVERINEQMSMQTEMNRLQADAERVSEDQPFPETEQTESEASDGDEEEVEMNKIIFGKLDYIIKRDNLYLSADISREELARMVKMNNTRFARMIKENTDTNLNGYLNNLRLNYAMHLLKEHPEYTLRAIAEASGINSMPTFHQLFKARTGMTPSEFKNTEKELRK